GGNACVDHGRLEGTNTGHFQIVHQIAGGEERAFTVRRVEKLDGHFRRREGHAVQLKIAGFLYLTCRDRHVGDDGFLDVGLPDAYRGDAVLGDTLLVHQAIADGKGTHGSGEV